MPDTTARRRGPAPLPDDQRRTHSVNVRVTAQEHAQLHDLAWKRRVRVADLARTGLVLSDRGDAQPA